MSDVDGPEVDVLLPVRSPAPWLQDTLDGLRAQTLENFRLVAVVHGAGNGIEALVEGAFPDAVIVTADSAWPLPQVLNAGLDACTAEFVARVDADDVPTPRRLERQADFLREHPDVVLVASPVSVIDENGDHIGRIVGHPDAADLMRGLRWKCVIQHPSVMFRREAVDSLGGYDARALHVEDYELWLRLATTARIDTLDEALTDYRVHPAQVTKTKVIGRPARRLVGRARLALAAKRGESTTMARMRQAVWSSRQVLRELGRRSH